MSKDGLRALIDVTNEAFAAVKKARGDVISASSISFPLIVSAIFTAG